MMNDSWTTLSDVFLEVDSQWDSYRLFSSTDQPIEEAKAVSIIEWQGITVPVENHIYRRQLFPVQKMVQLFYKSSGALKMLFVHQRLKYSKIRS